MLKPEEKLFTPKALSEEEKKEYLLPWKPEERNAVPVFINKPLEERILPMLKYIGLVGAIIMTIAYIAAVIILIIGFNVHTIVQTITFAVLNAIIGLLIMQFLKIQGISFAKEIPKNKELLERYHRTKTKDKRVRSITYYWATSVTRDIIIKGLMVTATTAGIIYIVIEGSQDAALLLLAAANLLLFICFGFLAMSSAYEFYNTRHMQYISEQIKQSEEENDVEG